MLLVFHLPPLPRTLRACQTDLAHSDEKVRLDVVRDLGRPAPADERTGRIGLLRACLRDSSPHLRRQALLALADLDAREASPDVERLLSDPEIPVRQLAVLALGELADPGDDRLVGRLHCLLTAGSAAIRYQALSATVQLRPAESRPDLHRALRDADVEVRVLALRLVDEALLAHGLEIDEPIGQEVDRAAQAPEPIVRLVGQLVAHELGRGAPSDAILDRVRGKIRSTEARDEQLAIEWAGRLGLAEAVPVLRRRAFGWFGWSHDPFKYAALGALARLGDRRAWKKLLSMLEARRPAERAWAIDALSKSAQREAVDALSRRRDLADSAEKELIEEALACLEQELGPAPR